MTDPAPTSTPTDEVWAEARDAYLAGATGTFVCRRFGLSQATFWRRAGREGWLRRDRVADHPEPDPLDLDAPVEPAAVARDKTWRRLSLALEHGRAAEAQRWLRIHETLYEIANRDAALKRAARIAANPAEADARAQALRAQVFALAGVEDWDRGK